MSTPILSFRDLTVWQRAIQFTKAVYVLSARFPADERFGLTSQLRRAAVSVPSNIAEGHARQGREFVHSLSIARGSLAEAESQLLLAVELGFLHPGDLNDVLASASEVRRMSAALANKIAAHAS